VVAAFMIWAALMSWSPLNPEIGVLVFAEALASMWGVLHPVPEDRVNAPPRATIMPVIPREIIVLNPTVSSP